MDDTVQIFIMSRDRPEYLNEAICSVLNQRLSSGKVEVIISDNSQQDRVEEMIDKNYPNGNIKYIRRDPPLTILEHYRIIISECKEKYTVLFHDDDIMHPDYVETMLPFIKEEGLAGVGCNTFFFKKDFKKSEISKPHKFKIPVKFTSEKDFLEQNIPGNSGVAVFPGYMYSTECLKRIKLDNILEKGRLSDVLMLNSLLEYGAIIWIPDLLMYYRIHGSNYSKNLYTTEQISVFNRMAYSGLDKNTDLVPMRFTYLFQWLLAQDIKNIFLWKNRIVFKYLFFKSFFLMSKIHFWKSLLNNRFMKAPFLK